MKLLTNLSLVAVMASLVLVLTGQMSAATRYLDPNSGAAGNAVRTGVGRAQTSANEQQLAALFKEANLARVAAGGDVPSRRELVKELAAAEPAAKVGAPLKRGGVAVHRFGPAGVEMCRRQLAGRVFTCARGKLAPGMTPRFGQGASLASARKAARGVGKTPAPGSKSSSASQSALEKARALQDR